MTISTNEWNNYHKPIMFTKEMRAQLRKPIEKAYGKPLPKDVDESLKKVEDFWYTQDNKTSFEQHILTMKDHYKQLYEYLEVGIDFDKYFDNCNKEIDFNLKVKEDELLKKGKSLLAVAMGSFTNYLDMADKFLDIQPLYYDKNKLWYIWDFENFKWNITDETDILNMFDRNINNPQITINSKTKNEILESLRRRARLRQPKKPFKSWIQFKNKIVDVQTGEIKLASPEYFVMCPIPFELGETEETPMIDKYFKDWVVKEGLQDESYIKTLYQIVAYSCLQDQFLQRLFALTGSGSNGKGCFVQILTKLLGQDNVTTTDMKVLTKNNFETSSFYQKQACFMGEVDSYDMANTTLLKKLTGEDLIRYEFKGKTAFSEKSGTTFFISTNSLPISHDKSFGFYRRWLIIDFPNTFSTGFDVVGSIPEYEFNNLAKKIINITKELYESKSFANEGSYEQRTVKYEERSNPLLTFLKNECEESEEDMRFTDFCKIFNEYCLDHRIRPFTTKQISRNLKDEGYVIQKKMVNYDQKVSTANFIFNICCKKYDEKYPKYPKYPDSSPNPYEGTNLKSGIFGIYDIIVTDKEQKTNQNQSKNAVTTVSPVTRFDSKIQSWQPCCHPKGQEGICGKSPCNESEGLYYCQEHFELIQIDKAKEEKIIDLRQSNEV